MSRPIHLAYHCAFMNSDTIRFIMSAVIARHDRRRFVVTGYTSSELADDMRQAFDAVVVTRELADDQFAARVRADRIDVLVEMTGFSAHHRFAAMAERCAPVQISYLNHLGTSGVPNVDYILADEISLPPDEDCYYTEQVWRLPGSFLCYNYEMVAVPEVAPSPCFANGFVTFGCFGSGNKINDELIALWARLMQRVPGSRMYLRNHELSARDNRQFMIERLGRHAVAPERIRLDGSAPRDEVLRSYDAVDISLDTWPYCGGNTLAESLWQGVPVVTLKGNKFVSRYGASLLHAAGCAELVADNEAAYIDIAATLAASPTRLEYYRQNLRAMAREFGLNDAAGFAAKLDVAYAAMMRNHKGDLQP